MTDRRAMVLGMVALLLVAPVGAAVIVGALLLFGVTPRVLFLPGLSLSPGSRLLVFTFIIV